MGRPKKVEDMQMIETVIRHNGIVSEAAEELGVSRQTIYNAFDRTPEMRKAYASIKAMIGKDVEDSLASVARNPAHPQFFQTARYYSRVKMGWKEVDHVDVTSKGDKIEGVSIVVDRGKDS